MEVGGVVLEVVVAEDWVVLELRTGVVEVVEGTLGGAAELMVIIPLEEGEALIMLEKLSRMNAATIQLVMAR